MSAPRTPRGRSRAPWSSWRDESGGPRPPPPQGGIKIKDAGRTWWGRRWIEALERMSPEYASRLGRGRTYARAGRTHDLVVSSGKASAKVTGSRPEPYLVTLALAPLDDQAWQKALGALARKARYAAQLLAGEMPEDVDEVLREAGVSLFPSRIGDLTTACSCPDWANPCKHVAAMHYVLGEAFDRDPFLLFELRGRSRLDVLGAIRELRTPSRASARQASHGTAPGAIDAARYDTWRAPVPSLRVTFAKPAQPAALIAALGKPPSWQSRATPAELLGPAASSAAELARALALGSTASQEDPEEA